ncbi:type II secretion system protein GspL [Vibrio rumoiensis]|uniref:Type II secretion system protein GspL n=1 Tax=Vibrio rumoiensis 1S-45 TaxID=1188252 RepID=A0A1E5E5Z7_9VIBR|nr:type II secretion system protein GspL [Vibrio rumoiensis]OEF29447.1 type II secretion system protein GspL [Vibrio rumoiensis 1S-45]
MNEFLTIKLSSNPSDSIPWLVWSSNLKDVIASGELVNRDHLDELASYSQQRMVIGLLPSSDVLLTHITIPSGASRQLNAMLPFLLEDELTQDIDRMHFTVLKKQGDQATIATIERERLAQWVDAFKEVGIELKKVLPDCLALPQLEGQVSALHCDDQWLFRQGEVKGAAVDDAWLELFLQSGWLAPDGDALRFEDVLNDNLELAESEPTSDEDALVQRLQAQSDSEEKKVPVKKEVRPQAMPSDVDESAISICSYSDLPVNHEQLPGLWTLAEKEMMMVTLSQGAITSKANLLSGSFKAQASWFKHWRVWQKVAIAACVLVVVLLIQKTIVVQQLEAQSQAYHAESERIFRSVFPDKKRIPTVSYLKRSMQDEENALSGASGDTVSVLGWMAKLPESLQAVKSVTIHSLQFDAARSEIRINAQSNDFQSFEQLRTELAKEFSVDQGQLNKNGDVVQGTYVIRSKA